LYILDLIDCVSKISQRARNNCNWLNGGAYAHA
jgi:hypothetical protein